MNRMGGKRRNQDFEDEDTGNGFGDFEGGPPNKKGRGGPGGSRDSEHLRKIFIGGLSSNTTEESLKSHFEEWGEIVDCVVMRDPNSKRSRGFGFITYKHPEDVDKAQENRPHTLDGKEVETKRATPREESNKPEARMSIKKVFVGGIKEDIEQEHLQDYFSKFGNIISVDVIVDKNTNKKRGFAFCSFDDYDPVDKIVLEKSHYINGRRCDVKKALSKDEMEKAKAKEMSMANRQGNDGGMGGRGNRDRGGYMGGDSDFRGGRGGNFGGNQGNYNQGGGGNYGNQGGNFGNQGMQGGGGYNQQQSGWGNQGGGGNWGNQNQGGSGYNQGNYGSQGMGNQGGSGGNWGNNQGNWGSQGGSGMNQGGNQGFSGGSYNSSGNYGSSSGSYSYNANQGGGGGWGNQSSSGNYGSGGGGGSSNYGNYSSGGQSGDFGGNQRNQGGGFGGRR